MKTKRMWTKWLVCVVVAVLLTALCGCGTITYQSKVDMVGGREIVWRVDLDENVSAAEVAATKAYMQLVRDRWTAAGRNVQWEEGERYMCLRESYESATEYYMAMGYTGNEPNDPVETSGAGLFVDYPSIGSLTDKATLMSCVLQYLYVGDATFAASLQEWVRQTAADAQAPKAVRDCAMALGSSTTDVVLDMVDVLAVGDDTAQAVAQSLMTWLPEQGIDLSAVNFVYEYSHAYQSVTAKGNESSYTDQEGNTVYVWKSNLQDLPDLTIELHQKAPNVWVWELIAIVLGLAVGVILTVVIVRRKKNKSKPVAVTESVGTSDTTPTDGTDTNVFD